MRPAGRAIYTSVLLTLGAAACTDSRPPPADESSEEEATADAGAFLVVGRAPPAVDGIPSVVTLTSLGAEAATDGPFPSDDDPVIDQLGLAFSPATLVVGVGQTVTFTNSESLAHNVQLRHVESGEQVFDRDTDPAESATHTFERAGGFDVTCNVHPGMTAFVYATTEPYGAIADPDGRYELPVPAAGEYRLRIWSADPELASEREIQVVEGMTEVPG